MTCRPAKELVLSKEKPIPYQPPLPPNEALSGVDAAAGVTPVGLRPPFVTPAAAHSHPDCRGIPILIVAPHDLLRGLEIVAGIVTTGKAQPPFPRGFQLLHPAAIKSQAVGL